MRKFRKGDRVRVYGPVYTHRAGVGKGGTSELFGVATVNEREREHEELAVKFGSRLYYAHPKQCRRIVKKGHSVRSYVDCVHDQLNTTALRAQEMELTLFKIGELVRIGPDAL